MKEKFHSSFLSIFGRRAARKGWRRGALLSIWPSMRPTLSCSQCQAPPIPHFIAGSQSDGRHVICQGNVQSCCIATGSARGLRSFLLFFPPNSLNIPIHLITIIDLGLGYHGNRVDTESREFLSIHKNPFYLE
jgi:hypothetical protein